MRIEMKLIAMVKNDSYCDVETEVSGTLLASNEHRGGGYAIAFEMENSDMTYQDTTGSLMASGYNKLGTQEACNDMYVVDQKPKYIVRRLTPLECTRLQGFPDGWVDIDTYVDSSGKTRKATDSHKYKALGNSIALPSWRWVIKRMCGNYERPATMASLFDGISGFPLIWSQINGKGTVRWTSEIEEFPIAVCKRHFGDEENGEDGDYGKYI